MVAKVGIIKITVNSNDALGTTYDGTITGFGDVAGFYSDWRVHDDDVNHNSPASTFTGRIEGCAVGAVNSSSTFVNYSWATYASSTMSITNVDRANRMVGGNTMIVDNVGEWTVSPITDGIRLTALNYTGQLTDVRTDLMFVVFSGCKCQSYGVALGNNTSTTINIQATDGSGTFEVGGILTTASMYNVASGAGTHFTQNRGAIQRVGTSSFNSHMAAYCIRDSQGTSQNNSYFASNGHIYNQIFGDNIDWSNTPTSISSGSSPNQFVLTTSGSSSGDYAAGLIIDDTIGFTTGAVSVGTGDTSAVLTGSTASGMTPKVALINATTANTQNSLMTSGIENSGSSFGWKSLRGDPYGSHGASTTDGTSTTLSTAFKDNTDRFLLEGMAATDTTGQLMLEGGITFSGTNANVAYTGSRSNVVNYGYIILSDTENLGGTGTTFIQGFQDLSTGFIPSLSQIHSGLR